MNIIELRHFLAWSIAINYGVLLLWFGVFVFRHSWLYRTHTRWFKLSEESFDVLHYAGMATYKIGILLLNLVPLLVLFIIS